MELGLYVCQWNKRILCLIRCNKKNLELLFNSSGWIRGCH